MAEILAYRTPEVRVPPPPVSMSEVFFLNTFGALLLAVMFSLFVVFRGAGTLIFAGLSLALAGLICAGSLLWVLGGALRQIGRPSRPQWPVWRRLCLALLAALVNVPLTFVYFKIARPFDAPFVVVVINGLETDMVGTKILYAGEEFALPTIKPRQTQKMSIWPENGPVDVIFHVLGSKQVVRLSNRMDSYVMVDHSVRSLRIHYGPDGVIVDPPLRP